MSLKPYPLVDAQGWCGSRGDVEHEERQRTIPTTGHVAVSTAGRVAVVGAVRQRFVATEAPFPFSQ